MALAKTVTQIITNSTIAPSSYADSTTFLDLNQGIALAIECVCTYSTTSTSGARVDVIGSYDSTGWDTHAYDSFTMPHSAATSSYAQTFPVNPSIRYAKVRVVNTSTVGNISACSVWSHVQTA